MGRIHAVMPHLRRRFRPALARLAVVVAAAAGLLAPSAQPARATPLIFMPGAPLLSVVPPPNGYIFDLTPIAFNPVFAQRQQTGTFIPAFPGFQGADAPVVGGPCAAFRTGEVCRTLEPGAGFGVRDWEVELANETGPAVETLVARFTAPGINASYLLRLPRGTGRFFDFRYLGPTAPFFSDFSTLRAPLELATSIVDPISLTPLDGLSFADPTVCGSDCIASATPTDLPPDLTISVVPEPASLALLAAGLAGLALRRRRA